MRNGEPVSCRCTHQVNGHGETREASIPLSLSLYSTGGTGPLSNATQKLSNQNAGANTEQTDDRAAPLVDLLTAGEVEAAEECR